MPTLYHRTTSAAAEAILESGFRDRPWHGLAGVFLSDVPLDSNEGAKGTVLLLVTIEVREAEIADFEIIEDGKPYREWIVPAALVNERGKVSDIEDMFREAIVTFPTEMQEEAETWLSGCLAKAAAYDALMAKFEEKGLAALSEED